MVFSNPFNVAEFVKECLAASDSDLFYSAVEEETLSLWRQSIFEDLSEIEDRGQLVESLVTADSFRRNGRNVCKLGGSSQESKYIHIDLVQRDKGWSISRVWKEK
ncbi:MAG: hypothetical protein D3910_26660 [Candidatus Electrothrix sp. ATG2]|nr:hypothetical protein [Candidatus Electrothrix sp. ATG2]